MLINTSLLVPDKFEKMANNRGLSVQDAIQQVFALGLGDWKSRGRNPKKERQARLREKELELQELRLRLREKTLESQTADLVAKNERRAIRLFKASIGPGLGVLAPDGQKVVLTHPGPTEGTWLGRFEDGTEVILQTKQMRPLPT